MTLNFLLAAKSLTLVAVCMQMRVKESLRIWLKLESKLKFYIRQSPKDPLNFEYIFDSLTSWLWNWAWTKGTVNITYIWSRSSSKSWLWDTVVWLNMEQRLDKVESCQFLKMGGNGTKLIFAFFLSYIFSVFFTHLFVVLQPIVVF